MRLLKAQLADVKSNFKGVKTPALDCNPLDLNLSQTPSHFSAACLRRFAKTNSEPDNTINVSIYSKQGELLE